MELNKGKMYVFSLMAVIFVLIIFVVIVTLIGLDKAVSSNWDIVDNSEILDSIYHIQLLLEKTRTDSKGLILAVNAEDLAAIEQSKIKVEENTDNLNNARNVYLAMLMSASEQNQARHIADLINKYNNQLLMIVEASMLNDQEAIQIEAAYIDNLVMEINEQLSYLYALNKDNTMMKLDRYQQTANTHSVILIICSIMAVVIIVVISIKILNILSGESNEQRVISYVQSSSKGKDADVLLIELDRCISDLKVVAYDLSKSTKDI